MEDDELEQEEVAEEEEQEDDDAPENSDDQEGEDEQEEEDVAVSPTNTDEEDDDTPAPVYLPSSELPETKKLQEALADPEIASLIQGSIREQVQQQLQVYGVTQAAVQAAAAQHPEIFAKYGSKINMVLGTFPESERHTRKAVDIATLLAATEHKAGTPEFTQELLKVANKLAGKSGAVAARPPKAPIPAASRPPSSASAGRTISATGREASIRSLMKKYNLDQEEAEAMMYDLKREPVRR